MDPGLLGHIEEAQHSDWQQKETGNIFFYGGGISVLLGRKKGRAMLTGVSSVQSALCQRANEVLLFRVTV